MQLAFTKRNSFILTTDGRVFSWGEPTPCLGIGSKNNKEGGNLDIEMQSSQQSSAQVDGGDEGERDQLNEIMFTNNRGKALISMIAAGISHVLALDTAGNVFAWGSNNSGQLGTLSANSKLDKTLNQTSKSGVNRADEEDVVGGFFDKPQLLGGIIN